MVMPKYTYTARILLCTLLVFSGLTSPAWACRFLEPPAHMTNVLWVHLEGLCFPTDQREWAVKGTDILEALAAGRNLDIQGVLVADDVMLDQLPLQLIADVSHIPQHIQEDLQQRGLKQIRVVSGAITIRDSQVEKVFATNLVDDVLVILGKVDVSGTTFLQSMDFSKIIFVKPVVFSNVNVEHEGFFIGAQFEDSVDFSHTNFGTHSRFHKAVFHGPVTFSEAHFKGVAEFLEVEFQRTANFSQATFLGGTGFSGSVFHGPVDFSEVKTKQEIYFRFSEFKDQIDLRHAQFQNVVDFSNSRFDGEHNFLDAEFAVQPDFAASNISVDVSISRRGLSRQSQWIILGGLVIVAGLYLWITKKDAGGFSA